MHTPPSTSSALEGALAFLKEAERLKDTLRTAHTSSGRRESVAEHTWRLCLMAIVLEPEIAPINMVKLLKICIIHDLGEAISGDIPAISQTPDQNKSQQERADLLSLLAPLSPALKEHFLSLWEEYESAGSPEARLAKGLDKLETIMQHNQGKNPACFDYDFNLSYGKTQTSAHPTLTTIRTFLDLETEQNAAKQPCFSTLEQT